MAIDSGKSDKVTCANCARKFSEMDRGASHAANTMGNAIANIDINTITVTARKLESIHSRHSCTKVTKGCVMAIALANAPTAITASNTMKSMRLASTPMLERQRSWAMSTNGTRVSKPILSWGHADTQSRQNVQSKFPTFLGINKPVPQPGAAAFPRRQSCVWQSAHTSLERMRTSSGLATLSAI